MEKDESSSRGESKVVGIPCHCWCGAVVLPLTSRSDKNPGRRYFRCSFAVSEQKFGDNHTFKWVDEALVDEVERLQNSIDRMNNEMIEEVEGLVMSGADALVMKRVDKLVEEGIDRLVMEKLEKIVTKKLNKMVTEKLEKLVGEALDKLVMEKVQEEILCMNLNG